MTGGVEQYREQHSGDIGVQQGVRGHREGERQDRNGKAMIITFWPAVSWGEMSRVITIQERADCKKGKENFCPLPRVLGKEKQRTDANGRGMGSQTRS